MKSALANQFFGSRRPQAGAEAGAARGVSDVVMLTLGTGKTVVLLLCGGDKSTQSQDIKRAKQLAAEL